MEEVVFANMIRYAIFAKIVKEVVFANMIRNELLAKFVEEVVFANMIRDEILAQIAKEVVFANMVDEDINVHNACITKHVIYVFQNMPCKKKKVYHITEMQI